MNKTILFLLLLLSMLSCNKKTNKPSWDLGLSIPLLKIDVKASDLINDSSFVESPDQNVSIVFQGDIFDFNFDSLVKFPVDLFTGNIPFPFVDPIEIEPGDPIFTTPFAFDQYLEIENGVKLEKIKVLQGTVHFEVFNNSGGDLLFDYLLDYSENEAGEPVHFSKLIPKQQWTEQSYDISNYTIGLTGLYNDTVNIIRNTITVWLAENAPNPVSFSLEDTLNISIQFEDMILEYAFGYFGKQTVSLSNQTVQLDIFDGNFANFQVPQATVSLTAINEYGVDGRFQIENMQAVNTTTNDYAVLEGAVLDSNFYFGKATETESLEHNIIRDTSYWDFSQSNILNLFGILPDQLTFSATVESNITGDSINRSNFFYANDKVSLGFKAIIDQGFQIGDILFKDTVSFEMDAKQLDSLNSLSNPALYLIAQNGFPFTMDIDIVLAEENFNLPDTIVSNFTLETPSIGEDLYAIDSAKSVLKIEVTDKLIEKLKKTKYFISNTKLSTAGDTPVKINTKDHLKLTLVIETDYTIETNNF